MKKITVLNLQKLETDELNYAIIADLEANRKANSIDLFLSDNYTFALSIRNDMPIVAALEKGGHEWAIAIEFYKRVNNQFFGKSHYNEKCIYGLFSHPWHKKVKQAEFTLFESEVDFDDLFYFDFHNGKYIPEFSTKQNWMQAYHLKSDENLRKALDYAMSQPNTPEMGLLLDAMPEKNLISG